jgi:hypothetical protein
VLIHTSRATNLATATAAAARVSIVRYLHGMV